MNKLLGYNVCERACSAASVVSNSVRPHELEPTRILYPCDSPGKNPGVGGHALLQWIFPTQGSNALQAGSLPWSHRGNLWLNDMHTKICFASKTNPVRLVLINSNSRVFIPKARILRRMVSSWGSPGSLSSWGRDAVSTCWLGPFSPQRWVDGSFTNSLPVLPVGRTVTISPFSGRLDISPQDEGRLHFYVSVTNQEALVSPDVPRPSQTPWNSTRFPHLATPS